ncbi:sigma 54-interacting transcriptional regulator [Haliangium sp.]|uniref:sigma 54-interacting transcriptional regulator n=1 Tax=Haliangium sp. TaxID=2663208 RepID=UPI003D0DB2B6
MTDDIAPLLAALRAAEHFERAAESLLDHVLDLLDPAAAAPTDPERAAGPRPLRAMLHLRPDDAYLGLTVRERVRVRNSGPDPVPSATAWRWLQRHRRPLLLDVLHGRADDDSGRTLTPAQGQGDFRSREVVLGRDTSHIIAVPLARHAGGLDGFVSVELAGAPAPDRWPGIAAALALRVDLAACIVGALPHAPVDAESGDPLLPVVGATMRRHIKPLTLFADSDATLLLQGETGVGKNYLARWCQQHSPRAERPFKHVVLTSEPEGTRAGALFGWRKGAFTGALSDREGLIEAAQGGTLFIDEIDKLPREGQDLLLTVLDNGTYRVIGDNTDHHADVRFIVGTNANLAHEVAEGRFRRDLYYRISDLPVLIPPLRQRRDEIVPWAEYFMRVQHRKLERPGRVELEADAASRLAPQQWPGNLRQLGNVIRRAYMFAADAADGHDITVRAVDVEKALSYEGEHEPGQLRKALELAAEAFVDQALVRGGALTLDHAAAFAGFVLEAAAHRLGERDAFVALGRAKAVAGNNHGKALKRERARVQELLELLERPHP